MKKRSNRNIKQQMYKTLFVEKKVNFNQSIYLLFYDKIFPEPVEFMEFLRTAGKDSMVKHAKNIVDRILFESPWDGMQSLYSNLLNMETSVLVDSKRNYIPQNHTIHSVHLYVLGIYLYFNFSVFHGALSRYFTNLQKDMPAHLYREYTEEEKAFLIFLDGWKCFSLLHDIAYPYEALFDANGYIKNENTKFLESFENINLRMRYNYSIKFYAYMILVNIVVKDSTSILDESLYSDIVNFEYVRCKKDMEKNDDTLSVLKGFRKLEYIYTFRDFEMCTSWLKAEKKAVFLKDQAGMVNVIVLWTEENKADIYINPKCALEKKNIERTESILYYAKLKESLIPEFYIQSDLEKLFANRLSELNSSARERHIDDLCAVIKKEVSVELAMLPQNMDISEIIYLIVQYINKWYLSDKVLEQGSFELKAEQFLVENIQLFAQVIEQNMKEISTNLIKPYGISFSRADMENALKELSDFSLKDSCKKIENEYYDRKREKAQLGIDSVNIFKTLFSVLWESQADIREKRDTKKTGATKKKYSKDMEMDDLIGFENRSTVSDMIIKLLKNESFLLQDKIEGFFEYKTDKYKYDHGIMAGRFVTNYFLHVLASIEEWNKNKITVLNEYQDIFVEGTVEAIYAIFIHNVYLDEYQKRCGSMPNHTLLINPFSYFGMFCDNLQVWDRDKSINHGVVEWTGNTLYGEDIALNLNEKTIEIRCRVDDIKHSFFKLKEGLGEYLEGADKLIELNLFE